MNGVARNPFTTAESARCRSRRSDQTARRRKNKKNCERNPKRHRDRDRCADHGERIEEGGPEPLNHLWGHNRVSLPDPRRERIASRPGGAPPGRSSTAGRKHGPGCGPMSSATAETVRRTPWLWPKGPAQDRSCPSRSARPRLSTRSVPAAAEAVRRYRRNVAIQRREESARRGMLRVAEDAPDRPDLRDPSTVEHENLNRKFHG